MIKSILAWAFFLTMATQPVFAGDPPFVEESTSKKNHANDELQFGVLVNNPYYRIYRSGGLGKSGSEVLKKHLKEHDLQAPTQIIYMNSYGYQTGQPKS